jgi:hypothetical protein
MKKIILALFLFNYYTGFSFTEQTLRSKIVNGNDDVEVYTSSKNFQSIDLELGGYDGGRVYVALRFQNISIPAYSKISKAYIQFTTKEVKDKKANIAIKCQIGNAAAYGANDNILSRAYSNTVTWNAPAWKKANERGNDQRTPDLSALVSAAISSNWQGGNALSFTLQGNANDVDVVNAASYESTTNHATAAELVIEYIPAPPTSKTSIVNGNDDVEVYPTYKYFESVDLELGGYDAARVYVALRFQNIKVPANANITKAYIQFTTKEAKDKKASISIKCQKGNAGAYGSSENIQSRPYTSTVTWNPPSWKSTNERSSNQRTPDLSALVKSAISSGWQSGNALSFILQGNANEVDIINAASYETLANHSTAPELVIEYSIPADVCANDNTKPTFNNCPANINLTTTGSTATATWTAPTVSDNCTANITPSVSSAPTAGLGRGSNYPIGTTTITYTAKDAKGNTATCAFTVTVKKTDACATDAVKPVFTGCPTNINLTTTGSTATATWTAPTVSDNCTANITPSVSSAPTAGLGKGSNYPIGTTTVTYTARDAKGNTATCVFTVTVTKINTDPCATDAVKPVFAGCPSNINLTTTGTTAVATWTTPTVSDNCTANITPSVSSAPTAGLGRGSNYPVGTTTVTYTARDSKGNTATCSFNVTVTRSTGVQPITGLFINEATGTASALSSLDFVEIFNNNTSNVSLENVYLSDSKTTPLKYKFPTGASMAGKSFRTVNADGDLAASTETTAAFGIGASGETLYLFQQLNGVLYTLDSLVVGATSFNTTWGRSPDGTSTVIPFSIGTPNATNNNAKRFFEMSFSVPRGLYNAAFNLTIQAPAGATIRYTTDKTKPTATTGTVYSGPISISQNTVLRAFAFSSTGESKVITQSYIFSNSVAQQLSLPLTQVDNALKELPIISISTTSVINDIDQNPCTFEYINKFGDPKSTFADAGIRYFGNSSQAASKRSTRIFFKAKFGYNKFKHKIFERAPLETYAPTDEFDALDLKAGADATQFTNLNDFVGHGLLRRMGSKDVHVRYANVILNGEYWGITPIREKFDNNYASSYYEGTDEDFDYLQTQDIVTNWPVVSDVYVDPGDGTLDQFNRVLEANTAGNFQNLKQRLDYQHFINSMLMFLAGDSEPEYKAVIGKNFAVPMVFFMQDLDFYMNTDAVVVGYEYTLANNNKGPHDLLALSGMGGGKTILEYKTYVRDQFELAYVRTTGAMTVDNVNAFYRSGQNIIKNAMPLELARWNHFSLDSWNNRIDGITAGMATRLAAVRARFQQFDLVHTLRPVTFSKASGNAGIGERILITNPNPNTVVYYTTDGTEVVLDNNPSPTAKLYNATTGIILASGTSKIRARAFATGNYGMYADAQYTATAAARQNALSFSADGRQDGQGIRLDWASNANKQADYYVVEKLDFKTGDFTVIDRIDAQYAKEIYAIHNYDMVDKNPLLGENVYRISVVLEGKFVEYAPTFTVSFKHISERNVYPNPAAEEFTVDLGSLEQQTVALTMTDMLGKVVARKQFDKAPNKTTFDVSAMRGGQYLLHIKAQGKRDMIEKVVVLGE